MKRLGIVIKLLILLMLSSKLGFTHQLPSYTTESLATIYIYRNDMRKLPAEWLLRTYPIKFSPQTHPKTSMRTIATLRNNRYLMMQLLPGKYIFNTKQSAGNLGLEVIAGETYFLYLDRGNVCPPPDEFVNGSINCLDRSASIMKVLSTVGQSEIRKLFPIEEKDIKEPTLVLIPQKNI
jgi:hypothetical protein